MAAKEKHSNQDIFLSVLELAGHLQDQPSTRDIPLDHRGESLLAVFQDPSFRETFPGLQDLKVGIIGAVARDIAEGLSVLRTSSLGICYKEGKMVPYRAAFNSPGVSNVVFSISWKNQKAFQKWKDGEGYYVSQEEINASIYHLAVRLSKIVKKGT